MNYQTVVPNLNKYYNISISTLAEGGGGGGGGTEKKQALIKQF